MGKERDATNYPKVPTMAPILIALIRSLGPSTVFILIVATFLFGYGSDEQKAAVIDTWILLRNESHVVCSIVIVTLIFALILSLTLYTIELRHLYIPKARAYAYAKNMV